jgi:hypothetical protein
MPLTDRALWGSGQCTRHGKTRHLGSGEINGPQMALWPNYYTPQKKQKTLKRGVNSALPEVHGQQLTLGTSISDVTMGMPGRTHG